MRPDESADRLRAQTWTVRLDSITPKSVLDDKGSNDSQAIKNMLLIVNRHIANVLDVRHAAGDVLGENLSMLKVFRHSGLPIAESEEGSIVHVTLTLGDGTA